MLDPSWFQLGSSWAHVGPRSGSQAAPGPTQALPNPFPVASGPRKPPFVPYNTQHRPQKGSKTSNLDLHNPQLRPQKTPTWLQRTPSQAPNPAAQARRMGRSLFNRVWKGLGRDLEGLGLAQGRLGTRIWAQHGSNLRQVGGNLGPLWVQPEPTWSQLGSMLDSDWLK